MASLVMRLYSMNGNAHSVCNFLIANIPFHFHFADFLFPGRKILDALF